MSVNADLHRRHDGRDWLRDHSSVVRGTNSHSFLRSCEVIGRDVIVTGQVLVRGRGSIVIGDGVHLDAAAAPIELLAAPGGRLELGSGVYIGPGASLEASDSVTIGPGAVIGPFAKILDNNWHGTSEDRAGRPESTPVVVGARARVGARATLLPGASLGDRSVLADDSVLSMRVQPGVVVAGAPARLASKLAPNEEAEPEKWLPGPAQVLMGPFRQTSDLLDPIGRGMLHWLRGYEHLDRLLPEWGRQRLARAEIGFALLNARRQLRAAQGAHRVVVHGTLDVRNLGNLEIGEGCGFAGGPIVSRLEVGPGAQLSIGPRSVINFGVLMRARSSISIGSGLLMGSRVLILDSHDGFTDGVTIGDNVWLAHGVTVLPGVSIGSGSAVSAGTVVDRDIPPGCLAVGSPTRFRPLATVAKSPR